MEPGNIPTIKEATPDWATLIQQHVQSTLQAALPHVIQQIINQVGARHYPGSPRNSHSGADRSFQDPGRHNPFEERSTESKVVSPEKFSGKKGNEVYPWFAQLRLVFRGKPRMY